MFGIGETELVIIVVFAFLLFGPDKLPGMGRTLGRVLRQFREASDGFSEVVQTNIMDPASEELEKSPKQRRREAAAEFEEDADVEAPQEGETAAAPKRETFAERKARLKAEREASAAAPNEDVFDENDNEEYGSASDADIDDEVSTEEKAPSHPAVADLYSVSERKSTRMQAKEQTAKKDAAQEPGGANEATQSVGEEDGDAQE